MQVSAPDYSDKSDDELLALAADVDSLTPEARQALHIALKAKGLDSSTVIAQFVEEQKRLDLADETRRLGLSYHGHGRRLYGKFNRQTEGLDEKYDATLFIVLSYFPLVPTGTYRVSREQGTREIRLLSKLTLDWFQVVWIWMRSLIILVA